MLATLQLYWKATRWPIAVTAALLALGLVLGMLALDGTP